MCCLPSPVPPKPSVPARVWCAHCSLRNASTWHLPLLAVCWAAWWGCAAGANQNSSSSKTSSNSATYSLQDGLWCWGFCPAPVNSFRLAWCWALCSSTHSFCTVFFSQAFSLVAMNVSYLLSFFSELLDLIFKASPGCGILAIWKCFYLSSKCEYFLMITEAWLTCRALSVV